MDQDDDLLVVGIMQDSITGMDGVMRGTSAASRGEVYFNCSSGTERTTAPHSVHPPQRPQVAAIDNLNHDSHRHGDRHRAGVDFRFFTPQARIQHVERDRH